MKRIGFLALVAIGLVASSANLARAATIDPVFAGSYQVAHLGSAPGVPANYGGLTFKDNNTLLLGGAANGGAGAIYSLTVTRDVNGHVTGFAGPATLFATAPQIDGGLEYGPGGVLFFTGYPTNQLGQIEPGSTSPDRVISLSSLTPAVASSVGTLTFVPPGFVDAGMLKIASYSAGILYDATLTPDGNGTFDVSILAGSGITIGGGPEGLLYIAGGNPLFPTDSLLVSEYGNNRVVAYALDANGNPILASRRNFVTGLSGAEGATFDPVTGDFLFSTFGGGNQIVAVRGFNAPPSGVPLPGVAFAGAALLGGAGLISRRRRTTVPD